VSSNDVDLRDASKLATSDRENGIHSELASTADSGHASHSPIDQSTDADHTARHLTDDLTTRSLSRTSRSPGDGDAKKARKGGKKAKSSERGSDVEKEADDEKEPPKPILLSEAPIPTVNIWQKRIEAQAAKVKPAPSTNGPAVTTNTNVSDDDTKKRNPVAAEEADSPRGATNGVKGDKPPRKSAEFSRGNDQPPRRNGPRGSRAAEKEEKLVTEPLPPVADATLWPDPKSAAATDDGKRKPQDSLSKVEQDETAPSKRPKEKWVAMPYVPTVNFQTPIPQRTSKPRGGARGGREAGARGGAHSNSAAPSSTATATSPGADKPSATGGAATGAGKETRQREGSGPTRANSLPPSASKRTSIDSTFSREMRKPSAPAATDRSRDQPADGPAVSSLPSSSGSSVLFCFNLFLLT
jgi:la-related protein 1